jgi:tetratricopeptide (TPR) repeat protein
MPDEAMVKPSVSGRLARLLEFLKLDPGNLRLRKDAIVEAREASQWGIAQELIDSGLERSPDDADLLAHAGFASLQAQRYDAAVDSLRAALALGVEPAEVRYNLAVGLFMQKRYEEALERLSAPLLPFELPLALPLRARCLHHLQRMEEAIADCRAHLEIVPEDFETCGLLALLLYESRAVGSAHEYAEAALRGNPRQVEAMLAIASMQSDAQQFSAARETFSRLLSDDPNCGRAWLGLALVELIELRVDAALRAITLAAAHLPEHIGTWHVLAWAQLMKGDIAAARAAFESALAIDRNFGETHGGLAAIAALEGRDDDARAAIKRAQRLDSGSLSARYAQMVLLKRAGREAEAKAVFESVLVQSPGGGEHSYRDLVARQIERLERNRDISTTRH